MEGWVVIGEPLISGMLLYDMAGMLWYGTRGTVCVAIYATITRRHDHSPMPAWIAYLDYLGCTGRSGLELYGRRDYYHLPIVWDDPFDRFPWSCTVRE